VDSGIVLLEMGRISGWFGDTQAKDEGGEEREGGARNRRVLGVA